MVDCGCFGEAIVLSNEETLLKNIVLLTAALFLCISPSRHIRLISERNEWVTSIWTFVYIVSLGLYTLHYLPVVDFTAYPIGADIRAAYNGKIPDRHYPMKLQPTTAAMTVSMIYMTSAWIKVTPFMV